MSKALEIASERYAMGEITREEYHDIRASLADVPATAVPPSAGDARPHDVPRPLSDLSDGSYFDTTAVAQAVKWLIKVNAAISAIGVAIVLKQSTVQTKLDVVVAYERNGILLAVQLVPLVILMALFLFWKKKSTDNLFVMRGPQSVTPAGAVYWYFVPVAWFWKPYEAMRNLVFGFGVPADKRMTLPIWWGLFWGSLGLALIAGIATSDPVQTMSDARAYVNWAMIVMVGDVVWLIAAYFLVETVDAAQRSAVPDTQEKPQ